MTTPTELGEQLSHRYGYNPKLVKQITITPNAITFTIYRLDQNGDKYIDDDGDPATYNETKDT